MIIYMPAKIEHIATQLEDHRKEEENRQWEEAESKSMGCQRGYQNH